MAEYRLSPAAQCDLDEIFNYTFQQWGAAQAVSYIDTLKAVCTELVETPLQGQDCSYIRSDYRHRHVGQPYCLLLNRDFWCSHHPHSALSSRCWQASVTYICRHTSCWLKHTSTLVGSWPSVDVRPKSIFIA
ncbi:MULTISPECIES: type II toxin-antitoxin system RelE/ParE family toxin [Nitrosomonas]|uniref:type II toxin-antitoxin system RelE/ParE family toxin n=1 Tax=Nitrosomonas TaxID=914 RepID=UPI0023F14925|nr:MULTISPECIES: type II toxin-antitoxin system RelE/ParE family toxin [Nitrosomonas]